MFDKTRKFIANAIMPKTPNVSRPDIEEEAPITVLNRWATYPSEDLTPRRIAEYLKNADQGYIQYYADLMQQVETKDIAIFSGLRTRKLAIAGRKFSTLPGADDAEHKEHAEYVESVIRKIPNFQRHILDLADAVGKGVSVLEIMWNPDATIRDLEWKHQRMFRYGKATDVASDPNELRLLTMDNMVDGYPVKETWPNKFVVHISKARTGWNTDSDLMRILVWHYIFSNFGLKDWAAFLEVYGIPLRLGKYDQLASDTDKAVLRRAVVSLGSDAAAIMSKLTEIDVIEPKNSSASSAVFKDYLELLDKRKTQAILGQMATSEGTPGKLGQEDAQLLSFEVINQFDCEDMSATIQEDLYRPIIDYKCGPQDIYPIHKIHYETPEDLVAWTNMLKTYVQVGGKVAVKFANEKLGIPLPEEGEEVLTPPQQIRVTDQTVPPPETQSVNEFKARLLRRPGAR